MASQKAYILWGKRPLTPRPTGYKPGRTGRAQRRVRLPMHVAALGELRGEFAATAARGELRDAAEGRRLGWVAVDFGLAYAERTEHVVEARVRDGSAQALCLGEES